MSFSKECDVSNLSENPCLNGEGVALLVGGQAASFLTSKCSLICSKESLNGRVNQLHVIDIFNIITVDVAFIQLQQCASRRSQIQSLIQNISRDG